MTREGPEGSNPSPGAYYKDISEYHKLDESKQQKIENLKIHVKIELVHVKTRKIEKIHEVFYVSYDSVFLRNCEI